MDNYSAQLVGGENLIKHKPVLSDDGRFVFVACFNSVKVFVTQTGQLLQTFQLEKRVAFVSNLEKAVSEEVVSIELHPLNPSTQLVVFTNFFNVTIWDYAEGTIVKKTQLVRLSHNAETNQLQTRSISNHGHLIPLTKTNRVMIPKSQRSKLMACYSSLLKEVYAVHFSTFNEDDVQQRIKHVDSMHINASDTSVAYSPDHQFVVTIKESFLRVFDLATRKEQELQIPGASFTCVACSGNLTVAAGCRSGRIMIYKNITSGNFQPKSLHWHANPVSDLCFSTEGSYLYSVGLEAAIVRWDVRISYRKNVLPRVGQPIKYVVCDPNHEKLALSHFDNCLSIVGSNLRDDIQVIETMAYGGSVNNDVPTTGLRWDARSHCLVTNGRIGHMQFYSPYLKKQMLQVDVVGRNFISESDKGSDVFNLDVTKADISSCGSWLATVEERDDGRTLPEIRLKFWKAMPSEEQYVLNSNIHLPHYKTVKDIRFAESSEFAVSISDDSYIKVWTLFQERESEQIVKEWWGTTKSVSLNPSIVPGFVAISSDSSILAVAFNNSVTLWDCTSIDGLVYKAECSESSMNHKRSLPQNVINESDLRRFNIKNLDFCGNDCSHLLAATNKHILRIWNILTLSVQWKWKCPIGTISCMVTDKTTSNIAVFLSNYKLYLFSSTSSNPLKVLSLTSLPDPEGRTVVSALFVPRICASADKLFHESYLCLLNSNQELLMILNDEELPKDNSAEMRKHLLLSEYNEVSPLVALSLNKAKQLTNPGDTSSQQLLVDPQTLLKEMFFDVPSHVLPPTDQLSSTVLRSLWNITPKDDTAEVEDMEVDAKDAACVQVEKSASSTAEDKYYVKKPKNFQFFEDYSWLES